VERKADGEQRPTRRDIVLPKDYSELEKRLENHLVGR